MAFSCEIFVFCMELCLRLGRLCRGCVSVDVLFPVHVTLLEGWFRCRFFNVVVGWSEAVIVRLVYLFPISLVLLIIWSASCLSWVFLRK